MRATHIPADEQYRLVMKCRTSGFTDHEWCLQNDIKPGTFYNRVKRLRQNGYTEIPDAISGHAPHRQEIVKIELIPVWHKRNCDFCYSGSRNFQRKAE